MLADNTTLSDDQMELIRQLSEQMWSLQTLPRERLTLDLWIYASLNENVVRYALFVMRFSLHN